MERGGPQPLSAFRCKAGDHANGLVFIPFVNGLPHSAREYNSSIFLVLETGLGGATIIAPNLRRELVSNWLLAFSGLGIVGLSFFITSTPGHMLPASAFLHAAVLVEIVAPIEMRFRQVNTSEVLADRILASSGFHDRNKNEMTYQPPWRPPGFNDAGKTQLLFCLVDAP